jgi:hypothetical protein
MIIKVLTGGHDTFHNKKKGRKKNQFPPKKKETLNCKKRNVDYVLCTFDQQKETKKKRNKISNFSSPPPSPLSQSVQPRSNRT